LEQKGYDVTPVNNGLDAIEKIGESTFDLVFLDENMPGKTGLETLSIIKNLKPNLPVVMITKSEEEQIMEQAIGSKIADYLIKPLNPNQILLSAKKILENKRLVSEKTSMDYQQEFRNLSLSFGDNMNAEEWAETYKKLIFWELELSESQTKTMQEILEMQKNEANNNFIRFIKRNYESWLNDPKANRPLLSHQLFKKKVFPELLKKDDKPLYFILIDNFRIDQWKTIEPIINEYFTVEEDDTYYSILPTTTAYARNSIFSGLLPSEISQKYPKLWVDDETEEGKNLHEEELLAKQLERNNLPIKFSYNKITTLQGGKSLVDNFSSLSGNKLNVVVYNFVDMLSHARTDMAVIKELAGDEDSYRSITKSWFLHSPLLELIQKIAEKKGRLIITTDHGTIRVNKAVKVIGDRETNTNLRYKQGKNLSFDEKEVFFSRKPERLFLPKKHISTTYIFAEHDTFLAYPNNYNYYVNHYKDTFQHGGISMEEIIIPVVTLHAK
jgi:CheY-like chemotaxis protein